MPVAREMMNPYTTPGRWVAISHPHIVALRGIYLVMKYQRDGFSSTDLGDSIKQRIDAYHEELVALVDVKHAMTTLDRDDLELSHQRWTESIRQSEDATRRLLAVFRQYIDERQLDQELLRKMGEMSKALQ